MAATLTDRRQVIAAGGALAVGLSLKYAPAEAQDPGQLALPYARWEDLMRRKWTWDRVVRGSRGINCTGHCAFNVYVKNGIVWREEQQGEYGRSGDDTPDYGPRGCQKGIRQAKYMYGKQRVLYPMKRVGERGEGKWQRISWKQATAEIADKFIQHATESGPESITFAMGTQMILKRASFSALFRFCNITGIICPETFAGVGDLPVGAYMTLGNELPGDSMAAVFKSRCCLVWVCNPAVTRIPDAHFFWEARYNGTEVITITPEFNGSAMHSSKWVSPKPGTDTALAMAMVQTIIAERLIDWDYVREQTDLPFLVRRDNGKFLRGSDLGVAGDGAGNTFYIWDEATGKPAVAPATGLVKKPGPPGAPPEGSLKLGALRPAVEGHWNVKTADGCEVEVTTVFELTKELCERDYTPEKARETCGVHPDVTRFVARKFANSGAGMIFAGYRSCKWLHGDKLHRAWLLMCALTGNTGREGGGMQTTQLSKADGILKYVFAGTGPQLKVAAISVWDYAHGDGKSLNESAYGRELADHYDKYYREAIGNRWLPDYARTPWKMGIFAGHNPANWRASGTRWRNSVFEKLDCIVAMTPDMSVTAMYADYVLPIAHHYERHDCTMEGRTPYLQVLDQAVPPLGESVDDYTAMARLTEAISAKAKALDLPPVKDSFYGKPIEHDYRKLHDLMTLDGKMATTRDIVQFLLDNSSGLPKMTYEELAAKGIVRVNDSQATQFGPASPYSYKTLASTRDKVPYETLTGRQQFYMDHEWMLAFGEGFMGYRPPVDTKTVKPLLGAKPNGNKEIVLNWITPHQKWGIHSTYSDNLIMQTLSRGGPIVWLSEDDAKSAGIEDNDWIELFNVNGAIAARAVVSQRIMPGIAMMYHAQERIINVPGSEITGTRGGIHNSVTRVVVKPTHMIGGYAQFAYGFNYYGTVGTNRDELVVVRKMKEIDWLDGEPKPAAATEAVR